MIRNFKGRKRAAKKRRCACGCGQFLKLRLDHNWDRIASRRFLQGHNSGRGYHGKEPIEKPDWRWIAGFLEGEGSFNKHTTIRVGQKQHWPLERLQAMLGGTIRWQEDGANQWSLTGGHGSREVMKKLRPLMSPRRQRQIDASLARELYVE